MHSVITRQTASSSSRNRRDVCAPPVLGWNFPGGDDDDSASRIVSGRRQSDGSNTPGVRRPHGSGAGPTRGPRCGVCVRRRTVPGINSFFNDRRILIVFKTIRNASWSFFSENEPRVFVITVFPPDMARKTGEIRGHEFHFYEHARPGSDPCLAAPEPRDRFNGSAFARGPFSFLIFVKTEIENRFSGPKERQKRLRENGFLFGGDETKERVNFRNPERNEFLLARKSRDGLL